MLVEYFYETVYRTLVKSVTSRILIICSQLVISLWLTDRLDLGEQVAIGTLTVNFIIYIGVERSWNLTNYAQSRSEKYIFTDNWSRTIFKTVTIRLAAAANNFLVPWLVTQSVNTAIAFLILSSIVNSTIYMVHERMWNRVAWGKQIKSLTYL